MKKLPKFPKIKNKIKVYIFIFLLVLFLLFLFGKIILHKKEGFYSDAGDFLSSVATTVAVSTGTLFQSWGNQASSGYIGLFNKLNRNCPENSHSTNNNKCECNTGYRINNKKNGCVVQEQKTVSHIIRYKSCPPGSEFNYMSQQCAAIPGKMPEPSPPPPPPPPPVNPKCNEYRSQYDNLSRVYNKSKKNSDFIKMNDYVNLMYKNKCPNAPVYR